MVRKITLSDGHVKVSGKGFPKRNRRSRVTGFRIPNQPIRVLAQSADTGSVEEFELLFTRKSDYTRSKYLD